MCFDKKKKRNENREAAITCCFPSQEANASMPRGGHRLQASGETSQQRSCPALTKDWVTTPVPSSGPQDLTGQ